MLFKQVENYKQENFLLMKTDSLRSLQLRNYEKLSEAYSMKIDNLNEEISKKNKTIMAWKVGGVTVTVGLVLWLLLK